LACLDRIRQHLAPGGRLVFDVFQPSLEALVSPLTGSEIEDTPEFDLPDGRKLRRTFRILSRHRVAQCFHLEMRYYLRTASGESTTVTQTFPMRYYFPIEVEHLLARSGLRIDSVFGDFDGSPLTDQSPEMIFTASLPCVPIVRAFPGRYRE